MLSFLVTILTAYEMLASEKLGRELRFTPWTMRNKDPQALDARIVGFQDSHMKRKDNSEVVRVNGFCLLAVE